MCKFSRSALPFTSERNASCPFSEGLCKSDFGNILLDSGVLDSHFHPGRNQNPRFNIRYQTHCAPLNTKNFTNITELEDFWSEYDYLYGNATLSNGKVNTYIFNIDVDNNRSGLARYDYFGNYKVL